MVFGYSVLIIDYQYTKISLILMYSSLKKAKIEFCFVTWNECIKEFSSSLDKIAQILTTSYAFPKIFEYTEKRVIKVL